MDGWIGVFALGLMFYLLLQYPLRSTSLGYKIFFMCIVGIVGLIVVFAVLSYYMTGLKGT